jgi:hypothetical protein
MEISHEILTRVTILDISVILMYIIGIVALAQNFRKVSIRFVRLFVLIGITHLFFTFVFYFFSLDSVTDAVGYYRRMLFFFDNWGETFGQGSHFIYFTLYPLVKFFGLTYFGCYFVYSFLGLLGYYFSLKVLNNISSGRWSNWYLILLLPNLHFWTVAIGKDSLVFFAISFFAYNYYFNKKWIYQLLPIFLIGAVRLHILVFIIIAFGIAQLFLNDKLKVVYKILIVVIIITIMAILYPLVLERVGFNSDTSLIDQFETLENVDMPGGSSVNMANKSMLIKWPSYMFRPLFFDSGGILTIIASFENLVWLLIFIKIFRNIKYYIGKKDSQFWLSFFVIMTITLPAAFILTNLGIANRQKTMIIPFLFIVLFLCLYKRNKSLNS